jgi:hypothetical protein
MKKIAAAFAVAAITLFVISCKSSGGGGAKLFCDTACLKDTLKFTGNDKSHPTVLIIPNNCQADSLILDGDGMAGLLKTKFDFSSAKINKGFVRCLFKDADYAWIIFNDCITGRGYQLKVPFNKKESYSKRTSGINNIDPKFSIAENIVAATDRGNIFVEDVNTGKKAMMTFGKAIEIDYDAVHEYIDSVNITNDRIWVKVKIDEKWAELEKKITWE